MAAVSGAAGDEARLPSARLTAAANSSGELPSSSFACVHCDGAAVSQVLLSNDRSAANSSGELPSSYHMILEQPLSTHTSLKTNKFLLAQQHEQIETLRPPAQAWWTTRCWRSPSEPAAAPAAL